MLLNPDVPLHHQIYQHLKGEIADGLWVGRADFPGEEELAERFGVSVITTRRALTRLADDGWISRGRGRRSQVIRGPAVPREPAPAIFPLSPLRPFVYKLLSHGPGVPSAEACEAFGLPPGSTLWLCSRLRTFQGRSHSVTLNAQRPELGERHTVTDLKRLPMAELLVKAGEQIATLTRRRSAAFAPIEVAERLGITVQQPIMVYTFALSDADGATIEWVRIHVHPDEPSPVEVLDLRTGGWWPSEAP